MICREGFFLFISKNIQKMNEILDCFDRPSWKVGFEVKLKEYFGGMKVKILHQFIINGNLID